MQNPRLCVASPFTTPLCNPYAYTHTYIISSRENCVTTALFVDSGLQHSAGSLKLSQSLSLFRYPALVHFPNFNSRVATTNSRCTDHTSVLIFTLLPCTQGLQARRRLRNCQVDKLAGAHPTQSSLLAFTSNLRCQDSSTLPLRPPAINIYYPCVQN
ncbi:hypothetical protein BOTBODRAFT_194938 [Botryobasidium botryosum FD-172 SS1]|uniref:Uncharacterized protein n=1 Tax=Botryobasidium botryosum (strain FD-172 SS1) TaxID=930990 RepID=A0A067N2J9_BOTB1|nr:hypothetical protein BOTBODRAFT_194938 [Botryobasidium botryosum FD-172 SS1]